MCPLDGNESLYVTTDPDAEVLLRAAEIIECDGWLQGDWGRPGGPRCIAGALSQARREFGAQNNYYRIWERIGFPTGDPGIDWNNAPNRTAAEVIALLRTAARG